MAKRKTVTSKPLSRARLFTFTVSVIEKKRNGLSGTASATVDLGSDDVLWMGQEEFAERLLLPLMRAAGKMMLAAKSPAKTTRRSKRKV